MGSRVDAEKPALTPMRSGLKPDRDVMTIGDLIYYQYAKIIAKSAFGVPEGREAEGRQCGSVKERFRGLGR